ncbi:MAG: SDR family oxidoreductase [Betaproteobacteria bacterium]|nr:SDR family oxidoreductase [Betaproteobacteria bacterium]
MARRLEGKKVFVTAAAQGMGRAAVMAMAREGAHIIATDIREDLLQTLRADVLADGGIAPDVRKLDVTAPGAIESMMESVGALDVLFNCAGYVHQGTILQASDDDWDISFAINVRSMVRTIRSALPAMIAHGGGSIINMASVCSSIKGLPNRAVYGTTKAAVLGLTKSIAADFVGQRVRCNAICPGTVETPSLRDRMAQLGDVDEARRMFTARQPMGRLANADEIVPIVVYLASDESSFATGQWFNIDGGITI